MTKNRSSQDLIMPLYICSCLNLLKAFPHVRQSYRNCDVNEDCFSRVMYVPPEVTFQKPVVWPCYRVVIRASFCRLQPADFYRKYSYRKL